MAHRMLMVLVLVLFVGFASAQEYSFYEVEEGEDFDVWLSSTEIDSSDLQMSCVLLTPSMKNVLQVFGGEELTGDQDSQFEGRVEYKRTALKQGQIGLLFRGLTPTDSGKYNCEVASISGQWITLIYTEYFELKVRPVAHVTPMTPVAPVAPSVKDTKRHTSAPLKYELTTLLAFFGIFVGMLQITVLVIRKAVGNSGSAGRALAFGSEGRGFEL